MSEPAARVVILGAGFGGLELASRLSAATSGAADVTLIDKAEGFVFGFSKLDVMFGRRPATSVLHRYADLAHPGVRFVPTVIRSIDPVGRRVDTDAGAFEADVLVIALGADLDPAATPGLTEWGHEFYTVEGAFACADVLGGFDGGRVVVGVTSTPFKCPPAPSETVLLLDQMLRERGLRDRSTITLTMPLPAPIPPSPVASASLLAAFESRGIGWQPNCTVQRLTPGLAHCDDGAEVEFDLFLGVPRHIAPAVVAESGMCVDGWIPVDPRTLQTRYPQVYAVGDVTSVGTPKAGVFSERQADIVADRILAAIRGEDPDGPGYDGRGVCYLDMGSSGVALVEVTFEPGRDPHGSMQGPSPDLVAAKAEFGTDRIARWFGTQWV